MMLMEESFQSELSHLVKTAEKKMSLPRPLDEDSRMCLKCPKLGWKKEGCAGLRQQNSDRYAEVYKKVSEFRINFVVSTQKGVSARNFLL